MSYSCNVNSVRLRSCPNTQIADHRPTGQETHTQGERTARLRGTIDVAQDTSRGEEDPHRQP